MCSRIKIVVFLFLNQFPSIISKTSTANNDEVLSPISDSVHKIGGKENGHFGEIEEHKEQNNEIIEERDHFPMAHLTPEYGGYKGPIIPRKGEKKEKWKLNKIARNLYALKFQKKSSTGNGKFKRKKKVKAKCWGRKKKVGSHRNGQNACNPLMEMAKAGSFKLKHWTGKKFTKNKKQHKNEGKLRERMEEIKNKEKIEDEEKFEKKIAIGVDEAVKIIDEIQNVKMYTNYKNEEEMEHGEEELKEEKEKEMENAHPQFHHFSPFDVDYFLGNADKKGRHKKMEKSSSFLGKNMENFVKRLKERIFYVDHKNVHSARELFEYWEMKSKRENKKVEEENEEEEKGEEKEKIKEEKNKSTKKEPPHWTHKLGKLAKLIDKDCAEVGPRKGKGEHALCILGRLFTFCMAIKKEIHGIEEFDPKFKGEMPKKLEWIRQGAMDIFTHFSPKIDPNLAVNELAKKYNKMFKIKSDDRIDYDEYFVDDSKIKMRESSEKVGEKKEEKSAEKSPKNSAENSADGPSIIPAQPFAYLASKNRRKQQLIFHENQLEKLSTFLASSPKKH